MRTASYLLCIFIFINIQLKAQVTIGSNISPNKGALLDVKESEPTSENSNSTRGILLPRVKLTSKINLYPMFEDGEGSGTPNSNYTGEAKTAKDTEHIGLTVYNLNRCDGFGKGMYVWVGDQWNPLADVKYLAAPQISTLNNNAEWLDTNTILIRIPSGTDLYPFSSAQILNISWVPSDLTVQKANVINSVGSGLSFSANPAENWGNPSVNSTTYNFSVNNMSGLVTSANPYRSRETTVKFLTSDNECGDSFELTARLNQTNFDLNIRKTSDWYQQWLDRGYRFRTGGRFGSGMKTYRILITVPKSAQWDDDLNDIMVVSNAAWKSSYQQKSPNIFSSINMPESGGQEVIDDSGPIWTYNKPTRDPAAAANKYKTAGTITITDAASFPHFYPVEVSYLQCSTDFDKTNIPYGDPVNTGAWGNQVLSHTDQEGNTFYSAVFGDAGRWMITNVRAKSYSLNSGISKSLIAFDNTDLSDHDGGKGKYGYPVIDGLPLPPDSNWGAEPSQWRPEEGLLYNWYAATGRDRDDLYTIDEGQPTAGINSPIGDNEVEYLFGQIQGICPDGWYLPSDRDWNKLEKYIFENPGMFDQYDAEDIALIKSIQSVWTPGWDLVSQADRGLSDSQNDNGHLGHGASMKEACPPVEPGFSYALGSKGYSKEPKQNGLNISLPGWVKSADDINNPNNGPMESKDRGYIGVYWASSSRQGNDGWQRLFHLNNSTVGRTYSHKVQLQSVRCKKKDPPPAR